MPTKQQFTEGAGSASAEIANPAPMLATEDEYHRMVFPGPRGKGPFGDLLVLRKTSGPRLPLTAAGQVALALRGAIMKKIERQPVPDVLTGRHAIGSSNARPHPAYVALPGISRGDGGLLGAAVVLPRSLKSEERRMVERAAQSVTHLVMGAAGAWEVMPAGTEEMPKELRPETWMQDSHYWTTVTPVLLDKFPDAPFGMQAEAIVKESCERCGLLVPDSVTLAVASEFDGVPPSALFHVPERSNLPPRVRVHVTMSFPVPVRGPILLGAGRHVGLGLFHPFQPRSFREDLVGAALQTMAETGSILPVLGVIYEQILKLSRRDLIHTDEKSFKLLLMAYLGLSPIFSIFSEFEGSGGYADLALFLNRSYQRKGYNFLIELKYVKASASRSKASRRNMAARIEDAMVQGEGQLQRYMSDGRLVEVSGSNRWKTVTVVFVGIEDICFRSPGQPTQSVKKLWEVD
ncbi:type I-U CRISPR-associated protein Csb2 [Sorangium sp. So ce726]|uniref:type I-G CRISPR-associated protein Csb2 n=1 Tax=Sorangium sp. So ce726 TaxID=3133319 RepID=UPI003F602DA5